MIAVFMVLLLLCPVGPPFHLLPHVPLQLLRHLAEPVLPLRLVTTGMCPVIAAAVLPVLQGALVWQLVWLLLVVPPMVTVGLDARAGAVKKPAQGSVRRSIRIIGLNRKGSKTGGCMRLPAHPVTHAVLLKAPSTSTCMYQWNR